MGCDTGSDNTHTANANSSVIIEASKNQKKFQMEAKQFFSDKVLNSTANQNESYGNYGNRELPYLNIIVSEGVLATNYTCQIEGDKPYTLPENSAYYNLQTGSSGVQQRPMSQDESKSEGNIADPNLPMSNDEIVNLPIGEFKRRISRYNLTNSQLKLMKRIRKRGKNKVASRNSRQRKIEKILLLTREMNEMKESKTRLMNEYKLVLEECKRIKANYQSLCTYVLKNFEYHFGTQNTQQDYNVKVSLDDSILMMSHPNSTSDNKEETLTLRDNKQ